MRSRHGFLLGQGGALSLNSASGSDRFEAAIAEGRGELSCRLRANEAYRAATPPLSNPENIRGFASCVAYGLVVGTILDTIASRLLYAAQVALAASRSLSEGPKAPGRKRAIAAEDSASGNTAGIGVA